MVHVEWFQWKIIHLRTHILKQKNKNNNNNNNNWQFPYNVPKYIKSYKLIQKKLCSICIKKLECTCEQIYKENYIIPLQWSTCCIEHSNVLTFLFHMMKCLKKGE